MWPRTKHVRITPVTAITIFLPTTELKSAALRAMPLLTATELIVLHSPFTGALTCALGLFHAISARCPGSALRASRLRLGATPCHLHCMKMCVKTMGRFCMDSPAAAAARRPRRPAAELRLLPGAARTIIQVAALRVLKGFHEEEFSVLAPRSARGAPGCSGGTIPPSRHFCSLLRLVVHGSGRRRHA